MRSHAKASSAGSNPGRGISRRPLRRSGALAALFAALMAAACLLPGSAAAIEFRSLTSSFGPDGTSGSTFSEYLGPLAFDQGNKRLYALDSEEQELYGFDASAPGTHTPLSGSFPLSAPGASYYDDIAVDSSSHDIYFASSGGGKLYGFDESGNPLSGFPLSGFSYPCSVAIDSSGNIWVGDAGEGGVSEYSPSGIRLDFFAVGGEPCRIAFDSEDNLFTGGEFFAPVKEYTAASEYTKSKAIDPEFSYGIAVDRSTDELYVVHEESISVYDDEGTFLYEFGAGGEYYGELGGIAIDEATEEAFVSDYGSGRIDVFGPPLSLPKLAVEPATGVTATEATVNGTVNPRGLPVEDCHFEVVPDSQFAPREVEVENEEGEKEKVIRKEFEEVQASQKYPCTPGPGSIPVDSEPHAVSAEVSGLEPATVYHYRLVASNEIGEGHSLSGQFTTGSAAPLVEKESVEAVGNTDATVTAEINPRGAQTTYHLEYGASEEYGLSTEESSAFGFASDHSKHAVSVHIAGLSPETAYHFRFVATNEVGATDGEDMTFATYPATIPSLAPCPNDQFRTGPGARLPDCRAYEQATPIEKHGSNAQASRTLSEASTSGDRLTFFTNGGLPTTGGSSNLAPFVASRDAGGWSTDGLLAPTEPGGVSTITGWNEDLSATLVTGEAPEGSSGNALFLRDSATAAFQPGPVGSESLFPHLAGFAADPSHLIFESQAALVPGAAPGSCGGGGGCNLYDLDHGALSLVDRVPAGSETSCDDETGPACVPAPDGAFAGPYDWLRSNTKYGGASFGYYQPNVISRDGSRVFFTAIGSGQLYMREDGVRTVRISASQRTVLDPNGERPAAFLAANTNGSKVFFLSCEKLTDDSTAFSNGEDACHKTSGGESTQGQDLYVYDVETGTLTDLTVDSSAGDPKGASVEGLLGISDDGSYVYFVASGVLAPGAAPANCNGNRDCNLYVYHDGSTKFVTALQGGSDSADSTDWTPQAGNRWKTSRVAADGSAVLFESTRSLTGYDNKGCGALGSASCGELFRYSAPEEKLLCVSCNPTGIPPADFSRLARSGGFIATNVNFTFLTRNLSADGNRVFFETSDVLVPGDTNGVTDVYEWEAKGEGSCESESQDGGCIYLISSGTDPAPSTFLDASRNGDHVFFLTEQQLVPTDRDQLYDVYDAGVGAGLASQHALSPPTCTSTACQANPAPPAEQTPASATFHGPGNAKASKARRCPKGKRKVRRRGKVRCVRRRHRKHHRHHKRHHKRANVNRGGSK